MGGLTGALIGMGIPEYEAKRYEGRGKTAGFFFPFTQTIPTRRRGRRKFLNVRALRTFFRRGRLAATRVLHRTDTSHSRRLTGMPDGD